ncbi:DNA-directed RNA polymerase subunit omega [Salibacter halophilus]|jgi:DNA-directed RNA polymerase subunit K/omega|uniref:RNA polymerase Rpb6 n=1 Tax=Salibacter halophilus TaxID=1803916 RepID=A0A6N6M9A5_9FLAO|nr:DNA-directed RNA polymerase subunit omega [Salibacter halophilus]KAB1065666.1 RNA polymerase Rpb6 [Salibacter halophilus]
MDYKKTNAPMTTVTRDVDKIGDVTGNVYEALSVVAKRADQIGLEIKDELNSKLEEFASSSDNLEEIFENREQIEISKFYERLPKPTALALEEFSNGETYYRNPAKEAQEED